MNIDYPRLKHILLNQYIKEHNINAKEFYRGMCWLEDAVCHLQQKHRPHEITDRQMIGYLQEQLKNNHREIAKKDHEIHKLKNTIDNLCKLSSKDRKMIKRQVNAEMMRNDFTKVLKDRDYYLYRLNSTRTGESGASPQTKNE